MRLVKLEDYPSSFICYGVNYKAKTNFQKITIPLCKNAVSDVYLPMTSRLVTIQEKIGGFQPLNLAGFVIVATLDWDTNDPNIILEKGLKDKQDFHLYFREEVLSEIKYAMEAIGVQHKECLYNWSQGTLDQVDPFMFNNPKVLLDRRFLGIQQPSDPNRIAAAFLLPLNLK